MGRREFVQVEGQVEGDQAAMAEVITAEVREKLSQAAAEHGLEVAGGKVRRSSSRFCFGVEHGDYNGTELFGVGTDRFIWMAYKPNGTDRVRIYSVNVPDEGVVEFQLGQTPPPLSEEVSNRWARFPLGVDYILRREGLACSQGFDAVLYGNIPGGGMSRSASLSLNLISTFLEVSELSVNQPMDVVDLAQAVENDYIGSPCGNLDQIMIMFAREGMGTHYRPADRSIEHIPLGDGAAEFCIVGLDTGTDRPGLDKSTYKVRRAECEELADMCNDLGIQCLADIKSQAKLDEVAAKFGDSHPHLVKRAKYIFEAQQRFGEMLAAWTAGDMETVGGIFRQDGIGLRDDYQISGPELESMCDLVRTVPGVLGERMLGGGDKGASGAIVLASAVDQVKAAVDNGYPRAHPDFADKYAVHVCRVVDGLIDGPGL